MQRRAATTSSTERLPRCGDGADSDRASGSRAQTSRDSSRRARGVARESSLTPDAGPARLSIRHSWLESRPLHEERGAMKAIPILLVLFFCAAHASTERIAPANVGRLAVAWVYDTG